MQSYGLECRKGYLLATVEGSRYLVDTGIPFSVGKGELRLDGRCVRLSPAPVPGFELGQLSRICGVEVAGILGAKDLLQTGCTIDLPRGLLVMGGPEPITASAVAVEILPLKHAPVVTIDLLGQARKAILDTGAPVSYLSRHVAQTLPAAESNRRDWIGQLGVWAETPTWSLNMGIADLDATFEWGLLPETLDPMFTLLGVDAIFGGTFCQDHAVSFSPDGTRVWIEAVHPVAVRA